jgi:hypothetical protein
LHRKATARQLARLVRCLQISSLKGSTGRNTVSLDGGTCIVLTNRATCRDKCLIAFGNGIADCHVSSLLAGHGGIAPRFVRSGSRSCICLPSHFGVHRQCAGEFTVNASLSLVSRPALSASAAATNAIRTSRKQKIPHRRCPVSQAPRMPVIIPAPADAAAMGCGTYRLDF